MSGITFNKHISYCILNIEKIVQEALFDSVTVVISKRVTINCWLFYTSVAKYS
jgi:hypothetical protein